MNYGTFTRWHIITKTKTQKLHYKTYTVKKMCEKYAVKTSTTHTHRGTSSSKSSTEGSLKHRIDFFASEESRDPLVNGRCFVYVSMLLSV